MKYFFIVFVLFNIYLTEFEINPDIEEDLNGFQPSAGGGNISLPKIKISEIKSEELQTKYTNTSQDDSGTKKSQFLADITKIIKVQLESFGIDNTFNLEESLQKKNIQISQKNNIFAEYYVIKRDEQGEDLEGDQNWNYLILYLTDNQDLEERSIEYEIEIQYIYPLLPMSINHIERNLQRFEMQYKKISIDLSQIEQQVISILDVFKPPQNPNQNQIYFEPTSPITDENQIKFILQVIPIKYGEIEMILKKDISSHNKTKQLKITYESNFFYFEENLAILNEMFLAQAIEKSIQDIRIEVFHNLQELSKDSNGQLNPQYIDFIINSDPSLIKDGKAIDSNIVDYNFTTQEIGQNLMIEFIYDTTQTEYKLMRNTGKITIRNYFPMKSLYNPVIFPSRFVVYIMDILRKIKKKDNIEEDSNINLYQEDIDTNPFAFDIPSNGESIKNVKFTTEKTQSNFDVTLLKEQISSDLTDEEIKKLLEEIWGDQKFVTIKVKKVSTRKKKLLLL